MAVEKSGNDREQSDFDNVSSTMTPKLFAGVMELGIGDESDDMGGNPGTCQPKGQPMHIAEYRHRLHETKRIPHPVAIGAPRSYDERHPSHDVHHTTAPVEPRESEKQGKIKSGGVSHLLNVNG